MVPGTGYIDIYIYQTQLKIRHIVKTTYISTNLSVFLGVTSGEVLLTLRKTDKLVEK